VNRVSDLMISLYEANKSLGAKEVNNPLGPVEINNPLGYDEVNNPPDHDEVNNPPDNDDEQWDSQGQQPLYSETPHYEDWYNEGYIPGPCKRLYQREDEDWGTGYEQVSTLANNKHKAYQKALTSVDKVTPNTKSRRLVDYLTEVEFHADLTYGNNAWQKNPIALKAIVLTTFNMELRRQFLTKHTYETTSWSSLQTWLQSSTDQTPEDLKLQAITKLRLNQHAQGKKTLAEYNTQFTTLLQNALMDTPEHESWAIQTYIAGLNYHISSHMGMNPVTNQHWQTLDEVKQCAYRLNYHHSHTKNSASLAVMQTPSPASNRGRGRSLNRGNPGRGRGDPSRGRFGGRGFHPGQQPRREYGPSGRGGYGQRGRGGHSGRQPRGAHAGRQPMQPSHKAKPSKVNKSLWQYQEKFLSQAKICLFCFGDVDQCSSGGQQCPCTRAPLNVWDVAAPNGGHLNGMRLSEGQKRGIFPENEHT